MCINLKLKLQLEESSELIINELNWFVSSQDDHSDEKADELHDVQDEGKRNLSWDEKKNVTVCIMLVNINHS